MYYIYIYIYLYHIYNTYWGDLACQFAYTTRMIVDASSNTLVSYGKIAVTKPRINSSSKQTNIASSINQSNNS